MKRIFLIEVFKEENKTKKEYDMTCDLTGDTTELCVLNTLLDETKQNILFQINKLRTTKKKKKEE
jgi:hypothetical protein